VLLLHFSLLQYSVEVACKSSTWLEFDREMPVCITANHFHHHLNNTYRYRIIVHALDIQRWSSSKSASLWETSEFSDLVVVCGDTQWKVHKSILGTSSGYFSIVSETRLERVIPATLVEAGY
jgi:hypothetical protein